MDVESRRFEQDLLRIKRGKFLVAVEDAARQLNVKTPAVKFWDDFCPYKKDNEIAHIHIEQNIICIADSQLKIMTFEEIEKTAVHEVTHIIHPHHKEDFHSLNKETKINIWNPKNKSFTTDTEKEIEKKRNKKRRVDLNSCHFFSCEVKNELNKCLYCEKKFCKEHLDPRPPGMPRFKSTKNEDIAFMNEWRKPGGHGCVQYINSWETENENKSKAYNEALNRLLEKRRYFKEKDSDDEEWSPKSRKISNDRSHKKEKKSISAWFIFIIFFLAIIIFILYIVGLENILVFIHSIRNENSTINFTEVSYINLLEEREKVAIVANQYVYYDINVNSSYKNSNKNIVFEYELEANNDVTVYFFKSLEEMRSYLDENIYLLEYKECKKTDKVINSNCKVNDGAVFVIKAQDQRTIQKDFTKVLPTTVSLHYKILLKS